MVSKLHTWAVKHAPHVLVAIVLLVYGRTVLFDFVGLDDGLLVYENAKIAVFSLASLRAVFTTYDPELYVPLTLLTYQAEHFIAGFSPWIYHSTNILIHTVSTVLVWLCLRRMTQKPTMSLLGAVLFCIHPLQVETVAWVSARKDLLSGCLLFASWHQYLTYVQTDSSKAKHTSIALFLLAALAKITVAPLALLVFAWSYSVRHRPVKDFAPYLGISLVLGTVALIGKTQNIGSLSAIDQVLLLIKSFGHWLTQTVFPFDLRVIYQQHEPIALLSGEFLIPLVTITFFAVIAFIFRKNRVASLSLLAVILFYAPVFATFAKPHNVMFGSDRYSYIPLFFLIAALASLWPERSR